MSKWLKALGLAAVVAVVAVIVPLYGDPRLSPVTHAEWARMLLRGLAMAAALRPGAQASHVFSILSWKDSLSFGAEAYLHGENVSVVAEGGARRVVAPDEAGEVAYPLAVVRGGDYRLRVRIGGDPATPAAAEITRVAAEREVDLIVISSHGRTGLGRIIFGSTAEAVVRHATCPVLVVKPPPEEEESD